jgi:hypothetical protein
MFSNIHKLKYKYNFGMSSKKFNLEAKHKIKKKLSWLVHLILRFPTYLPTYVSK